MGPHAPFKEIIPPTALSDNAVVDVICRWKGNVTYFPQDLQPILERLRFPELSQHLHGEAFLAAIVLVYVINDVSEALQVNRLWEKVHECLDTFHPVVHYD